MDVIHIHTTSDELDNLPIVNGQIIVLDDASSIYYDMDDIRHNASGSGGGIIVDDAISSTSRNPVQNKVIYSALEDKADTSSLGTAASMDGTSSIAQGSTALVESGAVYTALADKADTSSLADVATSGSYSDLTNTPTLGTAAAADVTSSVTENSTDVLTSGGAYTALADKANTADLANVATSGSYSDLSGKPTLGTAAAKDVPSTGNASTSQVVMGDDSRLTDARPASDVSSWAKASTKPTYTAAEVGAIASTAKGANNGVAELDSTGKVPSSQLPSYVDDVLEYASQSAFPATGETGKIYIAQDTNKTYRWSGTAYVEISASLALGETSSTAYYGDKGKTAYNHSQVTSGNPHNVTASDVGLGNVGNFKAVSTVASQGLSDTEKANARANIGAGTSNFSGSYNDLSNKPTIPTVNNATLTIQKNGTNVQTFTANASSNATANITVPTKVSELTNDSGYTTNTGTITGITMNNVSKGTSGVVDLGTVITSHQDISGKADKVSGATNGNFAGLNSSGNLTDSGKKASDFATSGHTHSLSMATDTGTSSISLSPSTKYKLTAGGSTYVFTTPPDNNTWNANGVNTAGYVSAPTTANATKVWKTDSSGVPGWRDDANTWRGIQNNLTSDSTTDSLSAAQGKALNTNKADKSATVSTVAWDSTNSKITKTINGSTTDVVTGATILGGLTKSQVTTALGYTPPTSDTNTHRPIKVNGTENLGNNTTALNLKNGTNVTISASGGDVTISSTNTTYANVSTSAAGLAPKITDTSKFLKGDGTWSTPTNTTYANVSTSAAGLAPKVTSTSAFLKGDGTWSTPTNTTYANVSTSAAGLAPKVTSTSAFLKGDGTWATPANTTYSSLSAASGGTAVSLVTTGEKYTWNSKTSNTGTVTKISAGTGISTGGSDITTSGTISLASGVITAGSAGPTAATTGNEGTTVAIPRITVDTYGRVTGLTSYNLTCKNSTYTVNNATLTIQQNGTSKGTFTANSSTATTANIITDTWTSTAQVSSNNTVAFSGLDDSYGYDLYCQNKLITATAVTKTGSGTSTTLTYTVSGAATGDVCKLRILK